MVIISSSGFSPRIALKSADNSSFKRHSFISLLNFFLLSFFIGSNASSFDPGYGQITKANKNIKNIDNHIYVYQAVGYQCPEGVCKDVEKTGDYSYKYSNPVKELDNPMTEVNMDELVEKLHTYKFTFTYDTTENIYYFESVEKES